MMLGPQISVDGVLTYDVGKNEVFALKKVTCELKGIKTGQKFSTYKPKQWSGNSKTGKEDILEEVLWVNWGYHSDRGSLGNDRNDKENGRR